MLKKKKQTKLEEKMLIELILMWRYMSVAVRESKIEETRRKIKKESL